jgi:hypothetical protein
MHVSSTLILKSMINFEWVASPAHVVACKQVEQMPSSPTGFAPAAYSGHIH